MSIIRMEKVGMSFENGPTLFRDVNFSVEKGEVVVVLGASGCGKTTFLRCINLMERPTSGKVYLMDQEITTEDADLDAIRQKVGMVFQQFNLFSHLTVLENVIKAPMVLKNLSKKEAIALGLECLRTVGLQERADLRPDQLSGGQKQRVAIARCLAMKPEIILFDEPTSALDPTMVDEVLEVIRRLAKNGLTCVIVSHEIEFAKSVGSRVVFLAEQGIYESGTASDIFDNPQRPKTVAFIRKLKLFEYSVAIHELDYYNLIGQLTAYCRRYSFGQKVTNRLQLVSEELLTYLQSHQKDFQFTLMVSYDKETGEKLLMLAYPKDLGSDLLEHSDMDELSVMIIQNCCKRYFVEQEDHNYLLTCIIKD